MDINKSFPSKYLKASDIDDDMIVTVAKVKIENVGQGLKAEQKPVVYFQETDKGIVLNKTNAKMIAKIAGSDETEDWAGTKVRLISTEVEFQGDLVMAIRVRETKKAAKNAKAETPTAPVEAPDDSDIPFAVLLPLMLAGLTWL